MWTYKIIKNWYVTEDELDTYGADDWELVGIRDQRHYFKKWVEPEFIVPWDEKLTHTGPWRHWTTGPTGPTGPAALGLEVSEVIEIVTGSTGVTGVTEPVVEPVLFENNADETPQPTAE